MSPKKPKVKPEKRLEWLQRVEDGESPPHIAATDGVDPRTVRSNVEAARQERETKDARSMVLRNALERHYDDLVRYAQRLLDTSSGAATSQPGEYDPEIASALRQHIPRSKIWKWLGEETRLRRSIPEMSARLRDVVQNSVSADSALVSQLVSKEELVISGIAGAAAVRAEFLTQGHDLPDVRDVVPAMPAGEGFVEMHYGSISMGKVKTEHADLVRDAIRQWTDRARTMSECRALEKALADIPRVHQSLRDEVAIIALRRVVPGRCRYCPV